MIDRYLQCLPYAHWYLLRRAVRMPHVVDLARELPVPDTRGWRLRWPDRYAWPPGARRLDALRSAFARFLEVRLQPASELNPYHHQGGFPVDRQDLARLGEPGFPKSDHGLAGEILRFDLGQRSIRVALDYSDYTVLSSEVLHQVVVLFKSAAAPEENRERVVPVAFYAGADPRLLAVARTLQLRRPARKTIDLLGRFGAWTDAQEYRAALVDQVRRSPLLFVGGFGQLRPYAPYLQEVRRARLCLEVPGQGPTSYRLAEGMALGVPVVAARPRQRFPSPLVDRDHYLRIRDDASDVAEVCAAALAEPELLEHVGRQAARYFDLNLSVEATARRMIRMIAQA